MKNNCHSRMIFAGIPACVGQAFYGCPIGTLGHDVSFTILFYSLLGKYPDACVVIPAKPESRKWMPVYAGMTNTPKLVAEIVIEQ